MVFGSSGYCAGESVLDCLQAFYLERVDIVEKGIAIVEFGMDNGGGYYASSLVIKNWAQSPKVTNVHIASL